MLHTKKQGFHMLVKTQWFKNWMKNKLWGGLPVDDPAVNYLEDDDPLSTVFEEVRHLLLQLCLHFMLGDDLQVIPWGFAATLHLTQVFLQLVKIHLIEEMLEWISGTWCKVLSRTVKQNLSQLHVLSMYGMQTSQHALFVSQISPDILLFVVFEKTNMA